MEVRDDRYGNDHDHDRQLDHDRDNDEVACCPTHSQCDKCLNWPRNNRKAKEPRKAKAKLNSFSL